jgi:hypothetical protein
VCGVISVVNGYVCTNCADAAKARRGEDPHPSPAKESLDAAKADKAGGLDRPSRPGDPAVVFGGALLGANAVNETSATGATPDALRSPQAASHRVDILV